MRKMKVKQTYAQQAGEGEGEQQRRAPRPRLAGHRVSAARGAAARAPSACRRHATRGLRSARLGARTHTHSDRYAHSGTTLAFGACARRGAREGTAAGRAAPCAAALPAPRTF